MSKYIHELSNENSAGINTHGHTLWQPAMAMPYFVGFGLRKSRCGCGQVFKTREEFEAHYFYQAVYKGESKVQPVEWADLLAPSKETEKDSE